MGLKWTVLLFVGVLLSCGSCENWMAGGNYTQDNLTIIMGKINAFDRTAAIDTYGDVVTTLSTDLNTLWAPAWNVVLVYFTNGVNYDAVLYGYAFRGHWFWVNGIKNGDSNYLSIIIWKDYNCVKWITLNPIGASVPSGFSSTDKTAITNAVKAGFATRPIEDIWLAAQSIQAAVATTGGAVFNDKLAYTVIATQGNFSFYFAQFCAKDYIFFAGVASSAGVATGATLIMQMRVPSFGR